MRDTIASKTYNVQVQIFVFRVQKLNTTCLFKNKIVKTNSLVLNNAS